MIWLTPHLSDQMAERLRSEDQRVDINLLPKILRRVLLERRGATASARRTTVIGPVRIGCQVAASMGSADLQPRIAIECPVEDQDEIEK